MNAKLGTYTVGPQRVPFADSNESGKSPPYDVAIFGRLRIVSI